MRLSLPAAALLAACTALTPAGTALAQTTQDRTSPVQASPVQLSQAPAPASAFTPAQRAEIVAILREALKSDPSILRDAIETLQADEGRAQEAAARSVIAARRDALVSDPADPVAGNPAGDVTVVQFYDTRCPYCRRMLPTLAALLRAEPKLKLVYKDLPILGPSSLLESRALLAAQRQGGYLKLQDVLMRDSGQATPETIRVAATQAGLDGARLLRDMDDPAVKARLDANGRLARELGIQGTPAMVIGDKLIPGAVDVTELRAAVAEARGR